MGQIGKTKNGVSDRSEPGNGSSVGLFGNKDAGTVENGGLDAQSAPAGITPQNPTEDETYRKLIRIFINRSVLLSPYFFLTLAAPAIEFLLS